MDTQPEDQKNEDGGIVLDEPELHKDIGERAQPAPAVEDMDPFKPVQFEGQMGAHEQEVFSQKNEKGEEPHQETNEKHIEEGEEPFIPQGFEPKQDANKTGGGEKLKGSLLRSVIIIIVILSVVSGLVFFGRNFFKYRIYPKQTTLIYWGLWEDESIVSPVLKKFEDQTNIKVQYVMQSPVQYRERLQSAITRGQGPDVFRFHNTWIPMLQNELLTAPEGSIDVASFSTTYYETATRDLVAGNAIYGVPLMIDGLGLYYNEDLFASAGVSVPATWEDLIAIVPKLTVKDGEKIIKSAVALGTSNNVEHFSDIVAIMMLQNGVSLVNPKGDAAEEALIFYRKFAHAGDPVYTWNETLDNSIAAFASGKVAMIFAPSWRAFEIKELNKDLRFKISPIPQLPGHTVTWASYWVEGVSSKSNHKDEAWKLVEFLSSRDSVVSLFTNASTIRLYGEPYARVDLAETVKDHPFIGAYVSQGQYSRSFPLASNTFDNGINDRMIKYLEDTINSVSQGASPRSALETFSAGVRQVLTSYGLTTQIPQTSNDEL